MGQDLSQKGRGGAPPQAGAPPTRRAISRRLEGHPAREGRVEEAQEPKGAEEGKDEDEDRETPRGDPLEVTCVGGDATPP